MTDIFIPYTGQNVIIDSSTLSTLMNCARKADFRFNHNFTSISGKSVSLEMGSIVHKFLETYYKFKINGFDRTTSINHAIIAAMEYYNSPEVTNASDEDKKWAMSTCEQYMEFMKNDSWIPLEIEVVKQEILYKDDDVRILYKVKYDYIGDSNNGIYPVDHKTMKMNRDQISLNNQFTAQCILMKTKTMFVNKIGFQKTLKPEEKFKRVQVNYSTDRLMEWQSEILPYWIKMMLMYKESEYYPPNLTNCESKFGFCEYKNVCEGDRNMREMILGNEFKVGETWDVTND